jgi:hypothetical protein
MIMSSTAASGHSRHLAGAGSTRAKISQDTHIQTKNLFVVVSFYLKPDTGTRFFVSGPCAVFLGLTFLLVCAVKLEAFTSLQQFYPGKQQVRSISCSNCSQTNSQTNSQTLVSSKAQMEQCEVP